ncbi:hypothetical protein [Aliikangiella coralliicola]|uniref:Lipoprotein n=1 Tax=Aliikangiella coralliicola TaxID=2592383 RepID=A0A545U939_9GAMM|nr:hypothetical protein [Aliikangiella coralliicola]TQV85939.1 hypothetical protein FLL46_18650 [Aliikangiella coralliicola]
MKYLLSILLLASSSSLFAAADIVDACINCSEAKARHTALQGMEEFYYSTPQPGSVNDVSRRGKPKPKIFKTLHIFTNTGPYHGYSYIARIVNGGAVLVKAYDTPPSKGRGIFKSMHEYRVAYLQMIADAQAGMDYRFMQAVGKAHNKVTPADARKGDDETGACSENGSQSSPFDYFTGNTAIDTNAAMRLELKNYIGQTNVKHTQINWNVGGSLGTDGASMNGSIGGTLAIQDGVGHLNVQYSNHGQLVFDIRRNTNNTYYPTLNLTASTFGNGVNRSDNFDYGEGPGMDMFLYQNADKQFKINNRSFTFENNCIEKDWAEMARDLGLKIVNDTGFEGGGFDTPCQANPSGTTEYVYRWKEFVQTSRVVGDTMTITGIWVPRSLMVTTGSSNPC